MNLGEATFRAEELRSLPRRFVAAYLQANDWAQVEVVPDRYSIWRRADANGTKMLVPAGDTQVDYADRIGDLVKTLAAVERRSTFSVLSDMRRAACDVLRTPVPGRFDDGRVPMQKAIAHIKGLRTLHLAAAASELRKGKAFHSSYPPEALGFADRDLQLGHTEPGSFVFSSMSPAAPLEQPSLFGDAEPFPRLVTKRLATALQAMQAGASARSVERIVGSVDSGVSGNLCDAISALSSSGTEPFEEVRFEFLWSPLMPPAGRPIRENIVLPASTIPTIRSAGERLREIAPRECELDGTVVGLFRRDEELEGLVTVRTRILGRSRDVAILLGPTDYSTAIKAHALQLHVGCRGDLVREGQQWKLARPSGFQIAVGDGSP